MDGVILGIVKVLHSALKSRMILAILDKLKHFVRIYKQK